MTRAAEALLFFSVALKNELRKRRKAIVLFFETSNGLDTGGRRVQSKFDESFSQQRQGVMRYLQDIVL
jgi:hypothetical protein